MLTMEDIIREGHATLRQVAEPTDIPPNEEDKKTLQSMMDFLLHSQDPEIAEEYNLRPGVGIAAPQINIPKRMIAVRTTNHKDELEEYGLFNPKIISHSAETTFLESGEGCLSVDREITGTVPRYSRIKVEGYDLNGEKVVKRFRGFLAIVFQHEIDHLNGIMFYDRIDEDDPYKETLPPKEVINRTEHEEPLS
ncbi:peptide deformylase [Salipaludibacillus neizhouensis]|uniref:Peptide deformylase n=1 Tax=Salipaludibacillus neizhouensis TaxID=885475 RepID=A0A3A9KWA1_9BACI|nr:peptide deformylase [Salipaludibacillus neizhouensis]RKL68856.1 peptide deformylase [Salipaludibacillus neizhouensis]